MELIVGFDGDEGPLPPTLRIRGGGGASSPSNPKINSTTVSPTPSTGERNPSQSKLCSLSPMVASSTSVKLAAGVSTAGAGDSSEGLVSSILRGKVWLDDECLVKNPTLPVALHLQCLHYDQIIPFTVLVASSLSGATYFQVAIRVYRPPLPALVPPPLPRPSRPKLGHAERRWVSDPHS